jgi:hypothetical protein
MSPSRDAAPRISASSATRAVLAQKRDQSAAALQRAEESGRYRHRGVGPLGMRQAVDQAGDEFDEGAPGRLHAQRAVVAFEPLLDRCRRRGRLLEAESGQMFEQARIVGTGAIIDLRQFRRARGIVALEQFCVMPLHRVEMGEQVFGEGRTAFIAEEIGKALDRVGLLGQRMGLLVGDHLQPVLDPPQELISRSEFVARIKSDPVARSQHVERLERRPHPQLDGDCRRPVLGLGKNRSRGYRHGRPLRRPRPRSALAR